MVYVRHTPLRCERHLHSIKIFHERPLAMNVASKNWFEISLWFRESKRRNKFPPAVLLSESITNVLRSCRRVVSVYAFTFSVSLMKWFATNSEHNIQWLHWDPVLLRKKTRGLIGTHGFLDFSLSQKLLTTIFSRPTHAKLHRFFVLIFEDNDVWKQSFTSRMQDEESLIQELSTKVAEKTLCKMLQHSFAIFLQCKLIRLAYESPNLLKSI